MCKGADGDDGAILPTTPLPPSDVDSSIVPTNDRPSPTNKTACVTAAAGRKHDEPRRWYARGGFHVNELGMGLNVVVPPVLLVLTASTVDAGAFGPSSLGPSFAALLGLQMAAAAIFDGMSTTFCVVVVPLYVTSLVLLPATLTTPALPTIALALLLAIVRGGVCMSVCLHRYAAHAAFKCGPATRFGLNVLGCAAHQGGPIWWASQHRTHHKHCDVPGDPHSWLLDGVERAFCFFETGKNGTVREEFAPVHNDTPLLRVLDTFSFVVCMAEMALAYRCFGREGLFVSYTSIWTCQTATLWFNIMNHPPGSHHHEEGGEEPKPSGEDKKACRASNAKGSGLAGRYPAFWLLDAIYPVFSALTSESNHGDHHIHFHLAKRERFDVFYHAFVLPLELLGLVWDVKKVKVQSGRK